MNLGRSSCAGFRVVVVFVVAGGGPQQAMSTGGCVCAKRSGSGSSLPTVTTCLLVTATDLTRTSFVTFVLALIELILIYKHTTQPLPSRIP